MISDTTDKRLRYIAGLALLATTYVLAGRVGFTAAAVHPVVSSAWPPSGIALAALLLLGTRYWPAIALGAFVVNLTGGVSPLAAASISVGNTLEAVGGAWLLTRLAGFRPSLQRLRDALALTTTGALGSSIIGATIGTTALALSGNAAGVSRVTMWLGWASGDAIGILIVTPLILAWASGGRPRASKREALEATVLAAILLTFTVALFQTPFSYVYAIFPVTIWAALRFGSRGATTASAVVSVLAIWYTVRGFGPFATSSAVSNLFELQTFIALLALTGLIIAGVIAERRGTELELQRSRQQHRDIVHYASVGIFQSTPDGVIVLANPALARILGYDDPNQLIGRNVTEAIYWDST